MTRTTDAPTAKRPRTSHDGEAESRKGVRRGGARAQGALDPALSSLLRRQFFCCAEFATCRRVGLEEVEAHLINAGLSITPRPQRVLSHLPDVMQAIACIRGDVTAWNDLVNAHAWCLDRLCAEQLGANDGLIFARRFWRDLRRATVTASGEGRSQPSLPRGVAPRLQQYSGVRPLRLWLADRMIGAAATTNGTPGARRPAMLDSEEGSRTLPLLAGSFGASAT
ncbi:MAG: hypothetical protein KF724_10125 [Phycisphaeraceae bacterium]|nr:hypothetical protein [Phycisphaeraceae bacterium]